VRVIYNSYKHDKVNKIRYDFHTHRQSDVDQLYYGKWERFAIKGINIKEIPKFVRFKGSNNLTLKNSSL